MLKMVLELYKRVARVGCLRAVPLTKEGLVKWTV